MDPSTLEQIMAARLTELRVEKGIDGSGLGAYYDERLKAGRLIVEYERRLADYLRGQDYRRVWDIGCGIGQLGCLLASQGQRVVSLERARARHGAMQAVSAAVTAADPAIGGRIEMRLGAFPAVLADEDVAGDLAVCLWLAFTASDLQRAAFMEGLRRFKAAAIDIAALFSYEPDEAKWDARAEALARDHGFEPPQTLFTHAAAEGGRVVLLRPSSA